MVTVRRDVPRPDMRSQGNDRQGKASAALSPRDKKIVERLLEGKSEREVGKEFDLSQQRINEIKHTPAAFSYMASWTASGRLEVYGMAIYIIRDRLRRMMEFGTDSIDWESLIKLVKAVEPKELPDQSAYEFLHSEAERIADEMNLTPEGRAKLLQFTREAA